MKKGANKILAVLLAALMLLSLVSCMDKNDDVNADNEISQASTDLWSEAIYKEDTEIGNGKLTVEIEVKAGNKSITFTVHTDKDILGDALLENELIDGEEGQYGLYVTSVNGIKADYNADKAYWSFYKDGEYMNTGVDGAEISDGEHYELVYTTV